MIQTRAFWLHVFLSVIRIAQLFTDTTYLSNLDGELKEKFNEDALEVYAYIWVGVVVTCIVLDILCLKWRSVAKLFFPLEMLIQIFVNLVQLEETCQAYHFQFIFFVIITVILFLCEIRVGLIFTVVTGLA